MLWGEREEMKSALQMKSLRDEVRIADYVACFMHAVRERVMSDV